MGVALATERIAPRDGVNAHWVQLRGDGRKEVRSASLVSALSEFIREGLKRC